MAKTGRPPREFDKKTFEGLCHVQCTVNEIEAILHADQRSIDYWCQREYNESFNTVYKRYAEGGKASVRRNQLALSKTNASMAIWLGKVLLGQRDQEKELEDFRGILDAVLEIKTRNRPGTSSKQRMETEQPLCDQRSEGQQNPICSELGTETNSIRSSSIENNLESQTAWDDHSIMC